MITEDRLPLIRRLISKFKQDALKNSGLEKLPSRKPLAAGSVLIVEVDGEHWRFHEGLIGKNLDDVVGPSVYPCKDAVTLRQFVGE